jgi:hypothetical protein
MSFLTVSYPTNCASQNEREAFLLHLDEALRREHNRIGALYRAGEITETDWRTFLREVFRPRSSAVADARCQIQAARGAEVAILPDGAPELDIDLDAAFVDGEVA